MRSGVAGASNRTAVLPSPVEAMASLVAAWSVEPPLSIGLFGEWGSGKSFFMQKMKERVRGLIAETEIPEDRLLMEIALLSDRLDCTEECVRLSAHIDQFRSLIEGSELAGRKLNFLLQEMNREANTIGSKANDVEIARHIVEIKASIDRIKEQVQNVE